MEEKKKQLNITAVLLTICAVLAAMLITFFLTRDKPEEPVVAEPAELPIVTVGYSKYAYPPFHYYDDEGELTGFDIALAAAAAQEMNVNMVFTPIDWSQKGEMLAQKEVDILWGGLERATLDAREVTFTKAYLQSGIVLLMDESKNYAKFEDLQGTAVCALNFTPGFSYFRAYSRDVIKCDRSFTPTEYNALLNVLASGEYDCLIADTAFASYYNKENGGAFKTSDTLLGMSFAVAVRATDKELFDSLQAALDDLEANGTITKLIGKWILQP